MDFYFTAVLQGLCFSGLAFGIFISMKIFNIPDITTDGSYTLGGVVTAVLLTKGLSPLAALPVVLFIGAGAGAITGLIHTKLRINPLLAGILVMTGLYSVNLTLMGRSNIPLVNTDTIFSGVNIFENEVANMLGVNFAFVVLLVVIMIYLLKTDFGIAMRATGNSETMIKALGVNTDRMKIIGLAIANALTALSGYFITQLQGFSDINMGIGIVIVGLGSVIIGETFLSGFNIASIPVRLLLVLTGAVIFQLVLAFSLNLGIDATQLKLMTSVFVLLIVSLPHFTLRRVG